MGMREWVKVVVVVVVGAGLIGSVFAAGASAQVLQEFNVGWQPAAYPDLYAAISKNLFEKVGLKPKLVKFTSGPPMVAALRSGDIDMAVMGQPPFLAAVDQGVDLKVFLVEGYMAKSEWLVVQKGSTINKCTTASPMSMACERPQSARGGSPPDPIYTLLDMSSLNAQDGTRKRRSTPPPINPARAIGRALLDR